MDWTRDYLKSLLSLMFLTLMIAISNSEMVQTSFTPCTYFGNRYSSPEGNLVNCSWYSNNACCKRTEVTSVFGGMYPLYGASQECANQMNFLMCYFCSPEQYRWYNKRLSVCSDFCNSVYHACKDAYHKGKALGTVYHHGSAFCKGQKFEVITDNRDCFDFDPNVFSASKKITPFFSLHFLCIFLYIYVFILRWC